MPNALRTIRNTTRFKFALLALGAISLSALTLPAMAGDDDASDAGAKNPSTCRDVVNTKCLRKPRDDHSSQNQDTRNQDNAAAARATAVHNEQDKASGLINSPGVAHYDEFGRITSVTYPQLGITDKSVPDGILRLHPDGQREMLYSGVHDYGSGHHSGSGGNGGAAGHTGARHTLPPDRSGQSAAASPKAATPKSTTIDKATNTMTRDYRTGATTAPGGPPPAAAIGSSSKPSAEQLAAQSGSRDHRH
jgi:hypothetical protein